MKKMMDLLVASFNSHKIEELNDILAPLGINVISPAAADNIPEVEETGSTFEENAISKAVQTAKFAGMYVFADDSGLEVEALNGRPGIYSARYAGPGATNSEKIEKLLNELGENKNRSARFVCVIAIASPEGKVKTFRGEVCGQITHTPSGNMGFGYDPIFKPDGYDKTFAELEPEIKNKISHRARALQKALPSLRKLHL
jgi:XTP/dITP diphosphohydrolase